MILFLVFVFCVDIDNGTLVFPAVVLILLKILLRWIMQERMAARMINIYPEIQSVTPHGPSILLRISDIEYQVRRIG